MSAKFLSGVDVNNQRITSVADGSAATDAVTKQQLDAAIRGLDWKPEVVAASTANVNLAAPGTTLDGVTLAANDRVLLKDQTAPAENGIYVWTASGSALTRALDADSGTELSGATVTVQRGTVNADRVYRVTTDDPLTLGTTSITWVQVGAGTSSYTGGNGLTLTGTTFDVGAGTGISVGADTVSVDTSVVARRVAGDNVNATSTNITHNFGHRDVHVQVWEKSTNTLVYADVSLPDVNTATVTFASAPAAGTYRIVVVG